MYPGQLHNYHGNSRSKKPHPLSITNMLKLYIYFAAYKAHPSRGSAGQQNTFCTHIFKNICLQESVLIPYLFLPAQTIISGIE